jgi:DNA invertase Pin-like site-specific DNA recombinase
MSKLYNVGIYCRLSIDDANNTAKHNIIDGDESCSIENQRTMLSQFARMQGWLVTKTYCDDGYSGGDFNRPAVREMVADAQNGVIDLILCKDLSRFGRDYIEVGRYTDVLFPTWDVRFIALLDEIDTAKDDNDMMHFRSLMNDYHLKDLSCKIKAVFRSKIQKHGLITGRPPYGYLKSENNKHLLVPDPDAAPVIRHIFALRASGLSYNAIARTLNTEGVMVAKDYWAKRAGKEITTPTLWNVQVIRTTLRLEAYIGTLANNKKPVVSYKGDKRIYTDKADWIIHENAHEPLIDRETWDKVQAMEQAAIENGKKQSKRKPSLFGSKLFCLDCGGTLSAQTMGHPDKSGVWKRDGTSYICHKRVMTGKVFCSNHTIGENPLKKLILRELKGYAEAIVLDETAMLETLRKCMAVDNTKQHNLLRKEVKRLEGRLADLMKITSDLYEDKVSGVISESTFIKLMEKNEKERSRYQAQYDEQNGRLTAINEKILSVSRWAEVIRKHIHLEDLTRADVEELIDHIEVGESDYSSGHRVQEIRIYWRFVGCLTD